MILSLTHLLSIFSHIHEICQLEGGRGVIIEIGWYLGWFLG